MSHITTEDSATLRLPFKKKLSCGTSDLASDILLDIGMPYFLKFHTDILGLPGTYGGIIFPISKFFTVFTDMGIDIMLDSRYRVSLKGKLRPFILYASLPVTLLTIIDFVGTPFDAIGKTVMVIILLMLRGLSFSMMNCLYDAMVPTIVKNPNGRASLVAWHQGGTTLSLLLCTVGFMPVMNPIEDNQKLGYTFAITLFSLFDLLFMWICYSGVKRCYVEAQPTNPARKPDLLQSSRVIVGNRLLFILCIANLCTLGASNIKLAVRVYYIQYVLNDPILLSYMRSFSIGCIFIGMFSMPDVVRYFGKKKVYIGGLPVQVSDDLFSCFFGGGLVSFVAFSYLALSGSAFVNSLNWALVSDTVGYSEWRTGMRLEGMVYTSFTSLRKVSQTLVGFFPGRMLTQVGCVPDAAQADHTIEGLCQLISIYPGALAVVTIVAMGCSYSLNERMCVRIVEEVGTREYTV